MTSQRPDSRCISQLLIYYISVNKHVFWDSQVNQSQGSNGILDECACVDVAKTSKHVVVIVLVIKVLGEIHGEPTHLESVIVVLQRGKGLVWPVTVRSRPGSFPRSLVNKAHLALALTLYKPPCNGQIQVGYRIDVKSSQKLCANRLKIRTFVLLSKSSQNRERERCERL